MTTLTDIDKQIQALEAQKRKLIEDEKKSALKKAQLALDELNALGFNYQLVQGGKTTTRTRRSGIRDDVKKHVKASPGITRADLLEKMNAKGDTKAEQSISNALANLKKVGEITLTDGQYS